MKSLKESLFDSDLVTKDITFGDLFNFDEFNIVTNITARSTYQDLSKTFSLGRIKKASKITGSDKNETIYKGLAKIIEDIKFSGDPDDWDKAEFENAVKEVTRDFFHHSLDSYKKVVYVSFWSKGDFCSSRWSLFDYHIDEIIITLGHDLTLTFKHN